jgi:hypothetical protein
VSGSALAVAVQQCYDYALHKKQKPCQEYVYRSRPTHILNRSKRLNKARQNETPRANQRKQEMMELVIGPGGFGLAQRYSGSTDTRLERHLKNVDGVYCFGVHTFASWIAWMDRIPQSKQKWIDASKQVLQERLGQVLYIYELDQEFAVPGVPGRVRGFHRVSACQSVKFSPAKWVLENNEKIVQFIKDHTFETVEAAMKAHDMKLLSYAQDIVGGCDHEYFARFLLFNYKSNINDGGLVLDFDVETKSDLLQRAIEIHVREV